MKTQIIIRPTDDLKEFLNTVSHIRGQTLNGLIIQILWKWAEKNGMKLPENQTE